MWPRARQKLSGTQQIMGEGEGEGSSAPPSQDPPRIPAPSPDSHRLQGRQVPQLVPSPWTWQTDESF